MSGGFVVDQIKRTTVHLLLICGAGMLAVAALAAADDDYLYNVFKGPFPVSQGMLAQDTGDPWHQYLAVQFERLLPSAGGHASRMYVASCGNDKMMLVEVGDRQIGLGLKGQLVPIDDHVRTHVLPMIELEYPGVRARLAPKMFVARDYCGGAYAGLAICGPVAVACAIGAFIGMRRAFDPRSHSTYRLLQKMGDPEALSDELESQLAAGAKVYGACRFTQNWVVYRTAFRFQIMRLSELVWIYQRIVKHHHHGIPTGHIAFRDLM